VTRVATSNGAETRLQRLFRLTRSSDLLMAIADDSYAAAERARNDMNRLRSLYGGVGGIAVAISGYEAADTYDTLRRQWVDAQQRADFAYREMVLARHALIELGDDGPS
jgi:hypothetical protein